MSTDVTDIREAMDMRGRAEQASTRGGRRLFCLGRVLSSGVVIWQREGGAVFYVGKEPPREECRWCGKVIREGSEPVSHGICRDCESDHFGGAA